MKKKKQNDVAVLLGYAGSYKGLTFLGLALSAVAMVLGMAPYICIWLAARDLIAVAPDWTQAAGIARFGWMAFAFAVAGILCLPLLGRHIGIGPHHDGSPVGERGVGNHQRVLLVGAHSNAIGLTGLHAGKGRRQRQQRGTHEHEQPTTTDFHSTFTIFHRHFTFIHLVSLLQSYEKYANPANNT